MDKVLIAPATLAGIDGEFLNVLRKAGFELVFPKKKAQLTEDELLEHLKGIRAAIAGSEPYTRKVLDIHRQLRVIARAGVGFDAVDTAAATDPGVALPITPGTHQDALAQHTFAPIPAPATNL